MAISSPASPTTSELLFQETLPLQQLSMAKSKKDWRVDSGATCHMCNDQSMFTKMTQLGSGKKVTLGNGSSLNVAGERMVDMDMILTHGTRRT